MYKNSKTKGFLKHFIIFLRVTYLINKVWYFNQICSAYALIISFVINSKQLNEKGNFRVCIPKGTCLLFLHRWHFCVTRELKIKEGDLDENKKMEKDFGIHSCFIYTMFLYYRCSLGICRAGEFPNQHITKQLQF